LAGAGVLVIQVREPRRLFLKARASRRKRARHTVAKRKPLSHRETQASLSLKAFDSLFGARPSVDEGAEALVGRVDRTLGGRVTRL
jgi:hypothetical protein